MAWKKIDLLACDFVEAENKVNFMLYCTAYDNFKGKV